MRAADVKLNFHCNHLCPEDGSSIFIRMFGVYMVSTINATLSGAAVPLPPPVPSWQSTGHIIPLPLPLSGFLQATVLYAAPPLVQFLASHPGVLPKYLQPLRYVVSGAAPLGGLEAERFLKIAPPSTDIIQGSIWSLLYVTNIFICFLSALFISLGPQGGAQSQRELKKDICQIK
jgi:Acyl-CoA synthetases (AMP-forming)/AMP-acid ligases II